LTRLARLARAGAILAALTAFTAPALGDIGFATGRQGGSQYPVSVALSQILQKVPGVGSVSLNPGGGTANVVAVDNGQSELGITLSNSAYDGIKGLGPYKTPTSNIVQLVALHAFKVAIIVPANGPIKSWKDLAGKRINAGPSGFAITTLAKQLFADEKLPVKLQLLGPGQAVQAFKDGNIDGWIYSPSDRMAPFIELATGRDITSIQMPADVIKRVLDKNPSFYATRWPASLAPYPRLKPQVDTVGFPNTIIANKTKISDDMAYAMVKAIAENVSALAAGDPSLEGFDAKGLAQEAGTPLHPGAIRYFKERGWR
jgi:TRAP transporter TAXI family solute receptor